MLDTATFEQIAASLAHEVKNPLALVKANIELLEISDRGKRHQKNYRIMRQEIERINELLLDFIQIADPANVRIAVFSLNEMLHSLCDSLQAAFGHKIDFDVDFGGSIIFLAADEKKLRQVFYNLLKNSIESIKEKGSAEKGLIKVSAARENETAVIRIQDNGIGVSQDELRKTDEPFYTTKKGGSGLGLYFCKTVVSRHGGTFKLAKREEGGCEVRITIPIQ